MIPKVSVVMPVYNVEDYLVECLESVVGQTLKDIEIICVNDGSTDNSLAILEDFCGKDSRISVIDKSNEGYGAAMNDGIAAATGEYVGIVEPDDYIALNMYDTLYSIAAENGLDFIKADFYRFKREKTGDMNLVYNKLDKGDTWYGQVFDPSHQPQTLRFIMNTWSGIYNRSFLNANGIRHNETPGASFQDNGFWIQTFLKAKKAMILNKPFYFNRRDNPNSSVKSTSKVYCMNREYDYIFDIVRKEPELWDRFRGMLWLMRFRNYEFTLKRIDDCYRLDYLTTISEEMAQAYAEEEMDREVFSESEWMKLQAIIRDPGAFYEEHYGNSKELLELTKENKRLKAENERLRQVRNSTTFKVGKALMWVPSHVKKALGESRS